MDPFSEQAVEILESLASAYHRLRSFGYEMYRKNSLETWASSALFSGSPFTIHHENSAPEVFSRCLPVGVHVKLRDGRSVEWGLELLWDRARWTVSAEIRLETTDESILIHEFPVRSSRTIGDCVEHIQELTGELVAREDILSDPRIAGNPGPSS